MKTVLFSFPDDKARDRFLRLVKKLGEDFEKEEAKTEAKENAPALPDGKLLLQTLGTVKLDPPIKADHERVVALFVSGRKIIEGSLAELSKRFLQECDSHKASVEMKELHEGEWRTIRSRRHQQRVG